MTRLGAIFASASLFATISAAVSAEDGQAVGSSAAGLSPEVVTGERLFAKNCAVCHGIDGKGHGPNSKTTTPPTADLSILSQQNGGVFPAAKVADVIRNGGRVLGHSSRAMPAWGRRFGVQGNTDVARSRIRALVEYIRSLQLP